VEIVFNTYVIIPCYDFKGGRVPLANWDLNLLQRVMVAAIDKKSAPAD
jgi:hypothetical protein